MRMAKALRPTDVLDLPLLLVTEPEGVAVAQLLDRGWTTFGEDVVQASVDAELLVNETGVLLLADGAHLLSSSVNPYAPPGWWKAVDVLQQHVVVVVVPQDTDLTAPDITDKIEGLKGKPDAAAALVSISTGPWVNVSSDIR